MGSCPTLRSHGGSIDALFPGAALQILGDGYHVSLSLLFLKSNLPSYLPLVCAKSSTSRRASSCIWCSMPFFPIPRFLIVAIPNRRCCFQERPFANARPEDIRNQQQIRISSPHSPTHTKLLEYGEIFPTPINSLDAFSSLHFDPASWV